MACGRRTELTIATPNTGAVEKDLLFTSEEFACQLAYHEPLFPLEPKRLAFRRMSFTARSTSSWSKQVGPYDFASPMGNLEDAMKLQYGFALTAIAGVIVGGADSDEAGHAFQSEAGHLFRSEAGRGSDLMSATLRRAAAGRWDDVFLWLLGQADGSGMRRLRMLSPASSIL